MESEGMSQTPEAAHRGQLQGFDLSKESRLGVGVDLGAQGGAGGGGLGCLVVRMGRLGLGLLGLVLLGLLDLQSGWCSRGILNAGDSWHCILHQKNEMIPFNFSIVRNPGLLYQESGRGS